MPTDLSIHSVRKASCSCWRDLVAAYVLYGYGKDCPQVEKVAAAPLCSVAQALDPSLPGRVWAPTFGRCLQQIETHQREELLAQLSFYLSDASYRWVWRWDKGGSYSVKSAYHIIVNGGLRHGLHFQVWRPQTPIKVKVLIWRISLGRLPTRDRLLRLFLELPSMCVLCGVDEEIMDHLFVGCTYARMVWEEVAATTSVHIPPVDDVHSFLLKWRRRWPLKGANTIWWLILHAMLWMLWREISHSAPPWMPKRRLGRRLSS
ncbi:hypothetical protein Taro_048758 [Colocasia esculenta]|uniref:Reverse transcriptase zinc-binding domain-containing protein n=1 Tax=Colocasia esculenta TaxID=4460 RepID=A0A843X8Y9_COLES|nr:hypothetical protein [Colocasia esculenta]